MPTGGQKKMTKTRTKLKMKKKNNDKGYKKINNMYGGNSRTASSSNTLIRNFGCEESIIRVVLGLSLEKFRRKCPLRYSEKR